MDIDIVMNMDMNKQIEQGKAAGSFCTHNDVVQTIKHLEDQGEKVKRVRYEGKGVYRLWI
mgnify:CR=1 FL=1|tara:strand:+ start:195 stop:374 length:180 start_codon:yes stop_codon:yes gene_type:complete